MSNTAWAIVFIVQELILIFSILKYYSVNIDSHG